MTRIRHTCTCRVSCVANVSVWFQSKDRLRNGIFGFGRARNETLGHFSRCLWLSFLVLCSEYCTETFATQAKQKVKLTWELDWKTKTYKLRRSVNGLNCEVRGETTVFAGAIFKLIILQQTKTVPLFLWINLTLNLPTWFFSTSKNFPDTRIRIQFHHMREKIDVGLEGF